MLTVVLLEDVHARGECEREDIQHDEQDYESTLSVSVALSRARNASRTMNAKLLLSDRRQVRESHDIVSTFQLRWMILEQP